jgi:hypothetical protein
MRQEGVMWFDGVELLSDHGGHDMEECIAGQAMFGQIERGKPLDATDHRFSHVAPIPQYFVDHQNG